MKKCKKEQTVLKDIVERCDLNRNTFYYHFQDIPSLFEEMIGSLNFETWKYKNLQQLSIFCPQKC